MLNIFDWPTVKNIIGKFWNHDCLNANLLCFGIEIDSLQFGNRDKSRVLLQTGIILGQAYIVAVWPAVVQVPN